MTTYWFSTQNLKCVHFLYLWLQVEDQSPFALAPILDGHGKPQSFILIFLPHGQKVGESLDDGMTYLKGKI